MELTYDVTRADALSYSRYFIRVSRSARRARYLSLISCALASFLTALIVSLSFEGKDGIIVAICLAAGVTLVSPWIYGWAMDRTLKRHFDDPRIKDVFGPSRMEVGDQGIHEYGPTGESQITWDKIVEIVRDGRCIYICVPGGAAHVISQASYRGPIPFEQLVDDLERRRIAHS